MRKCLPVLIVETSFLACPQTELTAWSPPFSRALSLTFSHTNCCCARSILRIFICTTIEECPKAPLHTAFSSWWTSSEAFWKLSFKKNNNKRRMGYLSKWSSGLAPFCSPALCPLPHLCVQPGGWTQQGPLPLCWERSPPRPPCCCDCCCCPPSLAIRVDCVVDWGQGSRTLFPFFLDPKGIWFRRKLE